MYDINPEQQKRLDQWHYHRANVKQTERFELINKATKELAQILMIYCPPGRSQSLALTHLEDVRMRANASIVLDEE